MTLTPRSTGTIAHSLSGIDFPAGRDQLVDHARNRGAESDLVAVLKSMPDRTYQSMADVFQGVSEGGRQKGAEPPPRTTTAPPQSRPAPPQSRSAGEEVFNPTEDHIWAAPAAPPAEMGSEKREKGAPEKRPGMLRQWMDRVLRRGGG